MSASKVAASFLGISRLGSAFITFHWLKPAHICTQVISLHEDDPLDSIIFLIENVFHIHSPEVCE